MNYGHFSGFQVFIVILKDPKLSIFFNLLGKISSMINQIKVSMATENYVSHYPVVYSFFEKLIWNWPRQAFACLIHFSSKRLKISVVKRDRAVFFQQCLKWWYLVTINYTQATFILLWLVRLWHIHTRW